MRLGRPLAAASVMAAAIGASLAASPALAGDSLAFKFAEDQQVIVNPSDIVLEEYRFRQRQRDLVGGEGAGHHHRHDDQRHELHAVGLEEQRGEQHRGERESQHGDRDGTSERAALAEKRHVTRTGGGGGERGIETQPGRHHAEAVRTDDAQPIAPRLGKNLLLPRPQPSHPSSG